MNTKLVVGLVTLVSGVVVGAFALNKGTPQPTTELPKDNSTAEEDAAMFKGVLEGRYLPYSPSTFALRKNEKRVLYFHAPWCPICRPTDKEFTEKADQIPAGVVVYKVDYDTATALKKQYAITYQHTFVLVDANGNRIEQWNGGGLEELVKRTR